MPLRGGPGGVGGLGRDGGAGERAARLLGTAALREAPGIPTAEYERAELEQSLGAAHAALGDGRWVAAFAAGHALALEEAIAEALGGEMQSGDTRR